MKKIFSVFILFSLVTILVSCSDEEDPNAAGTLTLHFDNVVGDANLQLNASNTPYTNSKGEAYKLTKLAYYVSNISAKTADGKVYNDEVKSDGSAGYYLIDEANEESQEVVLKSVPAGEYTEVTFTIGVDANQVNQTTQTGALDPAKGLFLNWNSGYVFMAVEGASPASTQTENVFQYHVCGYMEVTGTTQVNNVKTITLGFNGDTAPVHGGHEPKVHLLYDVNKFFNGEGSSVTFAASALRHSPVSCVDVANNIKGAFSVDHVHAH